jgi:hypothetical protein
MEVRDNFRSITQFRSQDPQGFFIHTFVARPAYEVEKFAESTSIINLGVEYFGNLKLRFSVDHCRGWRRLDPARDGIGSCRLQHRHMEDKMDHAHGVWELKSKGMSTNLSNDLERAQVLLGELL